MDFIERIDGIRFGEPLAVALQERDGSVEFSPPRMELLARLERTQSLTRTDFAQLKPVADAAGLVAKECIPSPTLLHFRSTRSRMHSKVYPDVEVLYDDIAQVYREEIAALYAAGCRYCRSTRPTSRTSPTRSCASGAERGRGPGRAGAALRQADQRLRARRAGRHDGLRAHVPRQPSMAAGSPKAATTRSRCHSGRSTSTASSSSTTRRGPVVCAAAHSARARSRCSAGHHQVAAAGKQGRAQAPDRRGGEVRIAELLALSPQCGFASTIEGNPLSADDQKRKLELVVETAREVWGS